MDATPISTGVKHFETWDALRIAYQEWGDEETEDPPVLLHHGFVANADANWVATGVVEALTSAGRKVIAPDARGLAVLLATIDVPLLDLVGYSMGAIVSLIFASTDERVRRLVIGGVGSGV